MRVTTKRFGVSRVNAKGYSVGDNICQRSDIPHREVQALPRNGVHRMGSIADQRRAFGVLQIEPTDDLREIKLRYKQLAKRFHPDANGGDRGFEDRLKRINEAYGVLSASLG